MDALAAYREQLVTYLRKDCEAMARKSRKRILPQWAVRKARAGAAIQPFQSSQLRAVQTPDAVAKKLYLERRRAVRMIQKEVRACAGIITTLSKIRPSKMSRSRQVTLECHRFARLLLAKLADMVKGEK